MSKKANRIFLSFLLCTLFSRSCFAAPPKINVKWMNENRCWTSEKRTIKPRGIMVHSTASPGIMAPDWFSRWNKQPENGGKLTSVHAFVDDKCIMQYLPWCLRTWHCGRGDNDSGNDNYISIEMCEPTSVVYTTKNKSKIDASSYNPQAPENKKYFKAALKNMVKLCAYLCDWFNLEPDSIICHQEGYQLGIASDHADVLHWWPLHGLRMDNFRELVSQELISQKLMDLNV